MKNLNRKIENYFDLKDVLDTHYLTPSSNKITRFGSEYVRVTGITFRLSDHYSKHVHSSHIDVTSYQDIFDFLLENKKIEKVEITLEEFYKLYENGCYKNYRLKECKIILNGEEKKCWDYGLGKAVDRESAIRILYYRIFKDNEK